MEKLASIEAQIQALKLRFSKVSAPGETLVLEFELMPLENELAKHASIVIVFSAVTAESYIYDYATRHLSDPFVQAHLDKLDIVSKWVIVPQLITGKCLPNDGKWITLLRGLIKERNSIVHSKSQGVPFAVEKQGEFFTKLLKNHALLLQKARQAIELLDELAIELSNLDPEEAPWTQIHLK